MQSIAGFFKEENDFLYRKGFKKGVESTELGWWKVKVITNLLVQYDFSDEQIAAAAGVSVSFVKNIRDGLKK